MACLHSVYPFSFLIKCCGIGMWRVEASFPLSIAMVLLEMPKLPFFNLILVWFYNDCFHLVKSDAALSIICAVVNVDWSCFRVVISSHLARIKSRMMSIFNSFTCCKHLWLSFELCMCLSPMPMPGYDEWRFFEDQCDFFFFVLLKIKVRHGHNTIYNCNSKPIIKLCSILPSNI